MARAKLRAVVFDLDGVITGTARVHSLAWQSMFDAYLERRAARTGEPFVPFDPERDYLEWVDGKPRAVGIISFLSSRGIELPLGEDTDPPDAETVWGLGNRKNAEFQEVLRREGPEVFGTSVALVQELTARGIRVGVASSSRNCQLILELAGLEDLFETRIDGVVSKELGLLGKPHADIFTTAAARLGVPPGDCVVVEDALSGVEAGLNGNFGLVLGVARSVAGDALVRHGADLVVSDLGEVTVGDLEAWFDGGIDRDGWQLRYHGFDPASEKLRETLTSVGNGYLGVRGAWEGASAGEVHYPGTYLAGVFDKQDTPIGGRPITNNDMVNCPNWLPLELAVGRGPFVSPLEMDLLSYRQTLDLRRGVMERVVVCKDHLGRSSRIRSVRLASMADPHLCALRWELTPLDWSGEVTVRSGLDGEVENDGVARYRELERRHLAPVGAGEAEDGVWLHVETRTSKVQVVQRARTTVRRGGREVEAVREAEVGGAQAAQRLTFAVEEGGTWTVDKVVAIQDSLRADDPPAAAEATLAAAGSFEELQAAHEAAWAELWERADVRIDGDREAQRLARLHAYHLLCVASPHNVGLDAGMPARGLNGEAYRGHIFWDEVYIQPFFSQRFPEVAKALLLYRWRRLPAARACAAEEGHEGAMFPWQTADDGGEETQVVHFNPKSGQWGPDLSRRQRHVSIAIFFNAWKYVQDTGDDEFARGPGAELMLDIARFWSSIARLGDDGRFHIEGVMGPDEFHEKLPGAEAAGVRDNAYTNVLVSWLLGRAAELAEALPEAARRGVTADDLERWRAIRDGLCVRLNATGVMEQFEGYFGLEELDWAAYRAKYGDVHRMDRLLKAEGDSPDRWKVAKQADTLMAFYLLGAEGVARVLRRLGHEVADPAALVRANYDYYEPRTSHGSTLSKVVHAVVSAGFGAPETAWEWFAEALRSDVGDAQGGTTQEGIHCGVMAGTLDVIGRTFAGVDLTGGEPALDPHLPAHWSGLALSFTHRGVWYEVELSDGGVKLKATRDAVVKVRGEPVPLEAGVAREVALG